MKSNTEPRKDFFDLRSMEGKIDHACMTGSAESFTIDVMIEEGLAFELPGGGWTRSSYGVLRGKEVEREFKEFLGCTKKK